MCLVNAAVASPSTESAGVVHGRVLVTAGVAGLSVVSPALQAEAAAMAAAMSRAPPFRCGERKRIDASRRRWGMEGDRSRRWGGTRNRVQTGADCKSPGPASREPGASHLPDEQETANDPPT